jgi:hypothetical protein
MEAISQYKIAAKDIIKELLDFADKFERVDSLDSDDIIDDDVEVEKETLLTRIDRVLQDNKGADELQKDIERMLKMFYLQMRVKGLLKEFRDDYFV